MYNLGSVVRIPPGEGRTFHIESHAIAVFRTRDETVHAVEALCPHKQGPLADGLLGDGKIVCPLHAFKFDMTTGEPIGNGCAPLKTYAVGLSESGDILLNLETATAEAAN